MLEDRSRATLQRRRPRQRNLMRPGLRLQDHPIAAMFAALQVNQILEAQQRPTPTM